MKQKLALSCALINKPALLVLDEPTTGVDAVSRSEFWDMLKKLKQHNITIIVSTPYMDEAMRCDRVALIQDGNLLSVDQPQKIRDGFTKKLFRIRASDNYSLLKALRKFPGTNTAYPFGDSIHLTFKNDTFDESVFRFLKAENIEQTDVFESGAGIEDRFLELMEKSSERRAQDAGQEEWN
jgi:ABC-type multidrug transport system ATPase subunit